MDWVNVIKALDNEWANRSQIATMYPNRTDAKEQALVAMVAFMLRDCLTVGLSDEDRNRL